VGVTHEVNDDVKIVSGNGGDDLSVNHVIHPSELAHASNYGLSAAVVNPWRVDGIPETLNVLGVLR
jgi:hypothetical protein